MIEIISFEKKLFYGDNFLMRCQLSDKRWVSAILANDVNTIEKFGVGSYNAEEGKNEKGFWQIKNVAFVSGPSPKPATSSGEGPSPKPAGRGDGNFRSPEQFIRTDAIRLALEALQHYADFTLTTEEHEKRLFSLADAFAEYIDTGNRL